MCVCVCACTHVGCVYKVKITKGRSKVAWCYAKAHRKLSCVSVRLILNSSTILAQKLKSEDRLVLKSSITHKKGEQKQEEQSL